MVSALVLVACGDDDGGDDGDSGAVQFDAPAESAQLFAFLKDRAYQPFASESAVHPSEGPHGMVRTYLSTSLEQSLRAENTEHPRGSAAVKELYEDDGRTLKGWAVMVKTEEQGDGGQGWYWYEIFNVDDGSNPPFDGNGISTCTGCHNDTGSIDLVLTGFPLR